jgi:hypothetical protein
MKPRRRFVTTLATASLVALTTVASAPGAAAAAGQDHLTKGQSLSTGQQLQRTTYGGALTWLVMQSDGNLVLYTTGAPGTGRHVCWATNTYRNPGSHAVYQSDGNFVVYNRAGRATWASGTQHDGGTTVNLSPHGQLWAGYKALSSFCD